MRKKLKDVVYKTFEYETKLQWFGHVGRKTDGGVLRQWRKWIQ